MRTQFSVVRFIRLASVAAACIQLAARRHRFSWARTTLAAGAVLLPLAVVETANADWLIKTYSTTNTILGYDSADALISGVGLAPGYPIASQYAKSHVQDNNAQFTTIGLGQQIVGLPGAPTDSDNFVFVGEGTLNVNVSGNYYFRTATDDGSRLRIRINAGPWQQILSDDVLSGMHLVNSATIGLSAGDTVAFDWMAFDRSLGAEALLLYAPVSAPQLKFIGDSSLGLSLAGNSFTGKVYLGQSNPIASFADAEAIKATPGSERGSALRDVINIADGGSQYSGDWLGDELAPGMSAGSEHYLTECTGWLVVRPEDAGLYRFRSNSDDGARLRIDFNVDGDFNDDGEQLFGDDTHGPHFNFSDELTLNAGSFPIEYSVYNYTLGTGAEITAWNINTGPGFLLLGSEATGGLDVVQIPEPQTCVLAAAALLALARSSTRRSGARQ